MMSDLPSAILISAMESIARLKLEGWVDIERKPEHYEGKAVECPMWLIEPFKGEI